MLNRLTQSLTQRLPEAMRPGARRAEEPTDRMETRGSLSPLLPNAPMQSGARATLAESVVFESFHRYARSAVAGAIFAGLMKRSEVRDLDVEIMFVVPALTLVKAALESNSRHQIPIDKRGTVKLTADTCPPNLRPMLARWTALAPRIKEQRSNIKALRLYLAGKGSDSAPDVLRQLASEINGLAIEITQRRTYQDRLENTLEGAAAHVEGEGYESEEENPAPSAPPWPTAVPSAPPLPQSPARASASDAAPPVSAVPTAIPDTPALRAIRDVLYSAVWDDLACDTGRLVDLVRTDRARGISGVTALAMARVAKQMVTPDRQRIYLLEGEPLRLVDCPESLHPLFKVLTSRHAEMDRLSGAETCALRDQLLGTGATPTATPSNILALASLFNVFTAQVMGLQQHREHMEKAFEAFGL